MGTSASSSARGHRGEAREQAIGQHQEGDSGPWDIDFGIPFASISGIRPLADGTACTCFQGKLGNMNGGSKYVAIKTLKDSKGSSTTDEEDLYRELSILHLLQHPNIVRLAGAGQMPEGGLFIATELLSERSLSAAIGTDNCPEGSSWLGRARVRSWFPMEEAFRQAAGIASALAYMHDEAIPGAKILHRDIKPSNLVFNANWSVLKLLDFGLVKILRPRDLLGDNLYKMTGNTGSMRYMAPEVARSLPSNETSDVYSFAVVLWEMVSLKRPFHFYGVKELTDRVVMGGDRPRLANDWPEGLKDLLARCWSADMSKRPSMAQVEKRLRELLQQSKADHASAS